MANVPVNFGGTIVTAGNSISGSFSGMQSLGTGSITNPTGSLITAFKYGIDRTSTYGIVEATGVSFTIPAGVFIPLTVTSASLGAGSAPVIFYTN
jgi:hypothetical protein